MIEDVVSLVLNGDTDKAARIVEASLAERVLASIKNNSRSKLSEHEIREIFDESILIYFGKILNRQQIEFKESYFRAICNKLILNRLSKKKKTTLRYRELPLDDMDGIPIFDTNRDDLAGRNEIHLKALKMLDQRCLEHLRLIHIDKIKHAQIPDHLPYITTENSSKTSLNRCMNKLRTLVSELTTTGSA